VPNSTCRLENAGEEREQFDLLLYYHILISQEEKRFPEERKIRHEEGEGGKSTEKILEKVSTIDKCLISNIFIPTYQAIFRQRGKSSANSFEMRKL
jgi:hypothetical protein